MSTVNLARRRSTSLAAAVALLALLLATLVAPTKASAAVTSPVVNPDRSVTFAYEAPAATTVRVRVAGQNVAMTLGAGGVWSATVGPLAPNLYNYDFLVNGVATRDPSNPNIVTTSATQTTVLVPGPGAEFFTERNVPHGTVTELAYFSRVTNTVRRANVWLPPGYQAKGQRYPTFYLVHGGGGNWQDWVTQGRANVMLDNLLADGRIKPMVVVMPDGNVPGATNAPRGDTFPTELFGSLIPAVEKAFAVSHSAHQRALAGLSLGGLQVFNTLLLHPGEFDYIGDFSSGYFPAILADLRANYTGELSNRRINRRTDLFWIGMGNRTDIAYNNGVATRALFDEYGIDYEYFEYAGSGHTWETWRQHLYAFAPRIFVD